MRIILAIGVFLIGLTAGGLGYYYYFGRPNVEAAQAGPADQAASDFTNSLGMKMKLIPAGKFVMGSPEDELHRSREETQHEVSITKPFYLGVFEVTQSQYEKVMGANPSFFSASGGGKQRVEKKSTANHPVEKVSWLDAAEFCKKLSAKEGKTYRLPTEAEWEYACRAGTTTVFHVGNDFNSNLRQHQRTKLFLLWQGRRRPFPPRDGESRGIQAK